MPPRIPTKEDFGPLLSVLPLALHFPSPPESTTTFLILFHGLGDHEPAFAGFAQSLALPGVLGISVRGTSPLPEMLMPPGPGGIPHSHWGDDLTIDHSTGEIDEDPGFEKAATLVMDKLVQQFLIAQFGWETSDILLFGFGQGGSLALGLASKLSAPARVVDVTDSDPEPRAGTAFKGVVSIGGPLPQSMVSTITARPKSRTSVLAVQLEPEAVDAVQREFADVTVVQWKRKGVSMPQSQDEAFPLIKFFADRLNGVGAHVTF
ncbi:hypothetical protein B0T10DRAFT_287459 [Thelonectria olida]|uniref:Phospholipase/carboxylesterase/thioesterase domain-containing protein n=1 Tax=Thelonectria olida TaxID=1576542 RepID=A0A9P9AQX5_9HYPO|nr:hypothetical protein B0T10DRAFT_287459 [Thelonectria olida]